MRIPQHDPKLLKQLAPEYRHLFDPAKYEKYEYDSPLEPLELGKNGWTVKDGKPYLTKTNTYLPKAGHWPGAEGKFNEFGGWYNPRTQKYMDTWDVMVYPGDPIWLGEDVFVPKQELDNNKIFNGGLWNKKPSLYKTDHGKFMGNRPIEDVIETGDGAWPMMDHDTWVSIEIFAADTWYEKLWIYIRGMIGEWFFVAAVIIGTTLFMAAFYH